MHRLERLHRAYIALKLAAASVPSILGGFVCWIFSIGLLGSGIWLAAVVPEGGWLALAVCFVAAAYLAMHGAKLVFEALPGITPRRINDAPGRSRLARRDELRRGRII
jgi:hypothetical protein